MEATASALAPGGGGLGLTQRPVFRQGYGPDQLGQAYRPAGQEGGDSGGAGHGGNQFRQQFLEQRDKKMTEQVQPLTQHSHVPIRCSQI